MRVALALLIAPLVTPVVFAVFIMAMEPRMTGVSAAVVVGAFTAMFAYAATITIGLPAYFALRESSIGLPEATAIGAAIGLGVFFLYWLVVQPAPGGGRLTAFFLASTIAGAASSSTFFLIAKPRAARRVDL